MAKIAVDIVLLPPDPIMDLAIDINRHMGDKNQILNKRDRLPHVSLFMCVIDENDIPKAEKILNDLAEQFRSLSLTIMDISSEENASTVMTLRKTSDIQRLHEIIAESFKTISSGKADESMFLDDALKWQGSVEWVNNFLENESFDNYKPHITLGRGNPDKVDLPIQFKASKLALCHLGDFCTCRKVLTSVKLP